MPDAVFEHPRLIGIYDALDPDRRDLDAYLNLADDLGADHVVDLGCGTGVLALLLADRGRRVTGIDPAAGSLAVARAKPGAERVAWVHGDATAATDVDADLVTMTGNAAQAIVSPTHWLTTLRAVQGTLRPGGHLVFETRNPEARAWDTWNAPATRRRAVIDGIGPVDTWVEVTGVRGPLVRFDQHWVFASDGAELTSTSTLRFRSRPEVEATLMTCGFVVEEVRDAPDRPGLELVFVARRPG